MFVAWRDLRFAKGRFALMGTVVVLMTLLVGLVSGLAEGLARENVSAVAGLPADRLAFAAPPDGRAVSFADSKVSREQWEAWERQPGVTGAQPLAIRTLRAAAGDRTASVTAFAAEPDSGLAPRGVGPGRVVLSAKAAEELGVGAGDAVRLGEREAAVAAVAGEASYSHTPVVWTALDGDDATVIALRTGSGADLAAGDEAAGTTALSVDDALTAIGSYQAENGSLQLMRGFLFVISALVTGAFFTVWTIQRSADVAVLKALGASTPYLLRDALGQAVALLVGGTLAGAALAAGAGVLISGTDVPFVLDAATVLLPAGVLIALGACGAALAIRRITAVDPLTALGSAR
ncbi:FtsX-like permease family protein [Streptomyces sp. MUM 178J]|uniref:FtsX-like permease family protein n=1 Tax=Streptomyces sp. MUM 178J TaxID=2791991 RepID=UPI001F03C376|nr:ABC transporter permease [Streptomyces sp. MUM 178J]WRQ80314.1 FtsX-like permease family protein [Streptomyces sp. MUM 178J]